MAATRRRRGRRPAAPRTASAPLLLAAAVALPGVLPATAAAQGAPDKGIISFAYDNYRDWQPGAKRMTVESPTLFFLLPLSDSLAIQASIVYDAVTGASPFFHNTLSGASIGDYRTGGDFRITKWFDRWAVGAGVAYSSEQDYISRALSVDVRYSTPDNNRTYAFGIGHVHDDINSINNVALGQHRRTFEFMAGVTQVLNPDAIIQTNLTYSTGHGYYSDPYKSLDTRPNNRRTLAWLTRYNQAFPGRDSVLQLTYRLLFDSYGDHSNMLEAAWVQGLPERWTITPNVRYLTQHAADFYFDPPFPIGFIEGHNYTADMRLSSFGAVTVGLTVSKGFDDGWTTFAKYQFYRQRPAWYLGGSGSPGLLDFSARWFEIGFSKTF